MMEHITEESTRLLLKEGVGYLFGFISLIIAFFSLKHLGDKMHEGNIAITKIATTIEILVVSIKEDRTSIVEPLMRILEGEMRTKNRGGKAW